VAEVYVCLCRAMTERTVASAIREGACSFADVARKCGAGTVCGGCRPAIVALIANGGSVPTEGAAVIPIRGATEGSER
jgi:bacterioferritin-associated ferredoxin